MHVPRSRKLPRKQTHAGRHWSVPALGLTVLSFICKRSDSSICPVLCCVTYFTLRHVRLAQPSEHLQTRYWKKLTNFQVRVNGWLRTYNIQLTVDIASLETNVNVTDRDIPGDATHY